MDKRKEFAHISQFDEWSVPFASHKKEYWLQMPYVDIIIFSFHYLLDPKVAENVSAELSKESIIVFDEAHNIG